MKTNHSKKHIIDEAILIRYSSMSSMNKVNRVNFHKVRILHMINAYHEINRIGLSEYLILSKFDDSLVNLILKTNYDYIAKQLLWNNNINLSEEHHMMIIQSVKEKYNGYEYTDSAILCLLAEKKKISIGIQHALINCDRSGGIFRRLLLNENTDLSVIEKGYSRLFGDLNLYFLSDIYNHPNSSDEFKEKINRDFPGFKPINRLPIGHP